MLCGFALGAQGAIGTTYNCAPELACKIYTAFCQGDMQTALTYQRKLNQIINIAVGNPISYWKALLEVRGFDMGNAVFPGKEVTIEEKAGLEQKLKEIGYFD